MTKTILITGANGFTGRHACEYFLNENIKVIGVVRNEQSLETFRSLYPECEAVCCDFMQSHQVNELIRDTQPDYVLHLAGKNEVKQSWSEPLSYLEMNMMSTLYILDALRLFSSASCKVLIVGSMLNFSLEQSMEPPHPYSFSKTFQVLAARCWGHLFSQTVLIAQPSNLIGPGYSNGLCGLLARKIVEVERGIDTAPFHLSSLSEERDFLDVRDAIAAYKEILMRGQPETVYAIGTGNMRPLGEIISLFQSMMKTKLPLEVSQFQVRTTSSKADLTAIKALGWQSSISLEQSIQDILNFFRASR
jgi:GDP-4-dehydro-6-deoxy-D-mannose reductase